jgi:predicted DNA-binding ribbon-helix-helix protein
MKSTVIKRSVVVAGHKTSVSLEEEFWKALKEIAHNRNMALCELIPAIRRCRQGNLSSAIRVFIIDHYRGMASTVPAERLESSAMVPVFAHDEVHAL